MAAGIHGPGTTHAVKMLAEKNYREKNFREHPFGGILEVELDPFKDWPTRFETATWKWQTRPYTPEKIMKNLHRKLRAAEQRQGDSFGQVDIQEIKERIEFVQRIIGESHSNA